MNIRLLSILIIGAMLGLAIGFSTHEFAVLERPRGARCRDHVR